MNVRVRVSSFVFLLGSLIVGCQTALGQTPDGILVSEFVYDSAPFPSCHASTIAHTPDGLVVAFFGGSDEGNNDVGIWLCRRSGKTWTAPVEVVNGKVAENERFPCWNPVLYQSPGGPLLLFYKVGPSPLAWWGMLIKSNDHGKTWSKPERLPDGFLGPIKNKPVLVKGKLLCPSSTEQDDDHWQAHIERTSDLGATWAKTGPIADWNEFVVIQPTLLVHDSGQLQILCRSKQSLIVESWSDDDGMSWGPLTATALPNPDSGIDAVNLNDGRFLLVYNHTSSDRSPLNVAVSDDGKSWNAALELETEPGEYSYPAVICTSDGHAHITYTWKRERIKYVELDPSKLTLRKISGGEWPR